MDGFRFDLASILTRAPSTWHSAEWLPAEASAAASDAPFVATAAHSGGAVAAAAGFMPDGAGRPTGTPLADPPLVEMISEDPLLRNTKLIAEAWDCDGLKQARGCCGCCRERLGACRDAEKALLSAER